MNTNRFGGIIMKEWIIRLSILVFLLGSATLYAVDTDGDNVEDTIDIDDDNDGILDTVEGLSTCPADINWGETNNAVTLNALIGSNGYVSSIGNATDFFDTAIPTIKITALQGTWTVNASNNSEEEGSVVLDNDGIVVNNKNYVKTAADFIELTFTFDAPEKFTTIWRAGVQSPAEKFTLTWGTSGSATVTDPDSQLLIISNTGGSITFRSNADYLPANITWSIEFPVSTTAVVMRRDDLDTDDVGGQSTAAGGLNFLLDDRPCGIDTDVDNVPNHVDLDADNDGIPDNIEAQTTAGYLSPSGSGLSMVDVNSNGLDDTYESLQGGTDIVLVNTDGLDNVDYNDTDADNDGIPDCNESIDAISSCPVNSVNVGTNGLIDWAEGSDDYSDVSGFIDVPSSDLDNEEGNTTEVAYREILVCGAAKYELTAFQWRVISFSCDTGSNGIEALLGNTLGTYGDNANWVMYRQNDSTYTGNPSTDMTLMSSTDTVVPGKGYWIIADADRNASIDTGISGLSKTAVQPATNFTGVSGTSFDNVHEYTLPNSDTSNWKKVMIGNPFPKKLQLSDMFFANGADDFVSMVDVDTNNYIESVVYAHDSASLDPLSYIAITPVTPGFTDKIVPMLGFWIRLNAGNTNTNTITYPLEK